MNNLLCPLCKCVMVKTERTYICPKNHSYDISHSGYTNLLLSNKKNSTSPGDNKIMTDARKNFLNGNYFSFLCDSICNILTKYLKDNAEILDVGCGTGYYTDKVQQSNQYSVTGIDISKDAIKEASKINKKINYFVASVFDLPFCDNSFDALINIFSPKAESEFFRVLKKNGYLLEVVPESEHLKEIKKIIYGDKIYLNKLSENFKAFQNIFSQRIKYTKIISNEDILNLVKMTPYFYKTKKSDLEKIVNITNLETTFDFRINLFKKIFN